MDISYGSTHTHNSIRYIVTLLTPCYLHRIPMVPVTRRLEGRYFIHHIPESGERTRDNLTTPLTCTKMRRVEIMSTDLLPH